MSVINQNLLLTPEGYQISRSVRLRSSASAFLNRTYASAGSATTWTYSVWVKRGSLGSIQDILRSHYTATFHVGLFFNASDKLNLVQWTGSAAINLQTTQVFRDPSAWYHITIAVDTSQATSSNRVKLYVNGVQVTAFGTATYPSLNADTYMCSSTGWTHLIGKFYDFSTTTYFDGYLTEVNFIDGQALTPSSFGETDAVTGVWKPKRYAGTYGTNGFYLNFSDNSAATAAAIGKDYSGNGNNWTPNNISVTAGVTYDSMLDTPTPYADGGNGRGNYATFNPLSVAGTNTTLSEGNLKVTKTSASNQSVSFNTIGMSSGAFYWEMKPTAFTWLQIGVNSGIDIAGGSGRRPANIVAWQANAGVLNNAGTTLNSTTYAANDVLGFALDATNDTLALYKNNALIYTVTSLRSAMGLSADSNVFAFIAHDAASNSATVEINFGQRPFAYTPPTGFKALNTQNLPDSTIKKGNAYFDVTLWTGDGTSPRTIGSLAFQPDFIWTKRRSSGTANSNHWLFDSARGAGSNSLLTLESNSTSTEFDTKGGSGNATAITASGFTITGGTSNNNNLNESGSTFAAWQWKESASAGFDIVTGTTPASGSFTVSHSLGVAPAMFIFKRRSNTSSWGVWHKNLAGGTSYLLLDTTAAQTTDATVFSAAPSSTVLNLGSGWSAAGAQTYVAYLFAEVAGFSKFGSYTGNGSADGPFVYCGFRPRWVMFKRTDSTADWQMYDTARGTVNVINTTLAANVSSAESAFTSGYDIDFLSNGFKPRSGPSNVINTSGGTYIFAAFAENPFKNSLAR